jgi:hypothetical protein
LPLLQPLALPTLQDSGSMELPCLMAKPFYLPLWVEAVDSWADSRGSLHSSEWGTYQTNLFLPC